jgi:hypothetical protein
MTQLSSTMKSFVIGLSLTCLFSVYANELPLPLDPNYTIPGLITNANVYTPPIVPKPPYGVANIDPTFGTRITRIVGDYGTNYQLDNGTSLPWPSGICRHHYSKDQPWNADGSLFMINKGSIAVVLDGHTYKPKYSGYSGMWDDRWHPTLPYVRVNVRSNGNLEWVDVRDGTRLRSWTMPFVAEGLGAGEGNLSDDGRFVALASSRGAGMCVVDMDPQPPFAPYPNVRIGPVYTGAYDGLLTGGYHNDNLTISSSGKYIVVVYDAPNTDHLRLYDVNPTTLEITPRLTPAGTLKCTCAGDTGGNWIYHLGHADSAVNPFDANEDVMIGQLRSGSYCPQSNLDSTALGQVVMVRLRDNQVLGLTNPSNEGSSHHISLRNTKRPGWAYVGYWYSTTIKRFTSEIMAVKMDGSKTVERLAHHHSTASPYDNEPHAVPSPDGRRVIFASPWNTYCSPNCGSVSQSYVIDTTPEADLTHGGLVDFVDLEWFALEWLGNGCVAPDWCAGTDFDRNSSVDFIDFSTLANQWLKDSL